MTDIEDKIRINIVLPELKYIRTYTAKVIDNTIGDGKLKASCPDLGWEDEFSYAECFPRDFISSRILPEINDYVEISFHAGKSEYPVWGNLITEIKANNKFSQYSKETDRIIFEDRKTGDYIKYDSNSKKWALNITGDVEINGPNIKLNGESKYFVTHTELNTALQTFITALNLHTHSVPEAPGSTLTPTDPMSLDISSSQTQTIKTGG
jgi:hypothetical protein